MSLDQALPPSASYHPGYQLTELHDHHYHLLVQEVGEPYPLMEEVVVVGQVLQREEVVVGVQGYSIQEVEGVDAHLSFYHLGVVVGVGLGMVLLLYLLCQAEEEQSHDDLGQEEGVSSVLEAGVLHP